MVTSCVGTALSCMLLKESYRKGQEVTERPQRRRKQLLDNLKKARGLWELKQKALHRSLWRTRFGRGNGPDVRGNTDWTNEWMNHEFGALLYTCGSRNSVVGYSDSVKAGRFGVQTPVGGNFFFSTVRGSNPREGEIYRTRPDRSRGPPCFLYDGYRGPFPEIKRTRRGVDHPPPSSAEVQID